MGRGRLHQAIMGVAIAIVAVGSFLGTASAPANAADQVLLVSADGTNFSSALPHPLFSQDLRLVPHDSLSKNLWVRNTGTQAGRLRVAMLDATSDNADLAAAFSVSIVESGGRGLSTPSTIADAQPCTVLLSDIIVQPGQTLKVVVRASVANLDGRKGANGRVSFSFRAALSDPAVPGPTPATTCTLGQGDFGAEIPGTDNPTTKPTAAPTPAPSDEGGHLAQTGTLIVAQTLGIASLALVAGTLLVMVGKRRRRQGDAAH